MKNIYLGIALVVSIMLVVPLFAQSVPRDATSATGKTTFTNIAVVGLSTPGVPGYIEMYTSQGKKAWLYLDDNYILRVVSGPVLITTDSPSTSPPTIHWQNVGITVGLQRARHAE